MPAPGAVVDRFVELGGRRFHYTECGPPAAPALVLLHGVTGHARTWDHEARALAPARRVLALDQRGHGDSDPAPDGDYSLTALVADIAAFVTALGLARVDLVGLSLGGRVAIAYAATHPTRVDHLVVVDIGPDIAPAGRARVGMAMASAPERFETVEDAIALVRAANPRAVESRLRERVRDGLKPLPGGGFAWKYDRELREAVRADRWRETVDLWPLWTSLTCPTLLLRGAESDVLSAETAKRMIATQPRARLVEIDGAGHMVPGDRPVEFLEALRAFLGLA
jgi:esterase